MHCIAVHIAPDHPAFAGHFPGQPLLPGVCVLAEVFEALLDEPALLAGVGPIPCIVAAKFLAPVRPDARLVVQLQAGPRGVHFEVKNGQDMVASGRLEASR